MNSQPDLRERCKAWLSKRAMNAMLRQGSEVDDLVAFVIAERGRSADAKLANSLPLCLYFATVEEREEFVAMVREVKPTMTMKAMP